MSEDRIREIGTAIFNLIKDDVPSVFDRRKWTGELMEWAMKDAGFKVQLLRFVDLLPSLQTDALVVRLLKEYFADEEITPMIMKWGVKGLSEKGLLPKLAGKAVRSNVEALARQFIAGTDPETVMPVLHSLRSEGYAVAVDLLGEVVLSDREARDYTERYLSLLDYLHQETATWEEDPLLDADQNGPLPAQNISIKVSSLYSQLDPMDWDGSIAEAGKSLRPVFEKAQAAGASITLDMEHSYLKDLTIAIFKNMVEKYKDYQHAGIALQTYLHDTEHDVADLIEWAKRNSLRISIRLVKGAYWDYESVVSKESGWPLPVFSNKAETDRSYEKLTKVLLDNTDCIRPAFATHNIRSISNAIAYADAVGLPKNACEFQVLYGMAEPIRAALQHMGHRVRVYAAVGELIPGMAYLVRRLLENISNESFLRKSFVEGMTVDDLIQAPQVVEAKEDESLLDSDTFANEPVTDFSKEHNRQAMQRALKNIRANFNTECLLYVGGKEQHTDNVIVSVNPAQPSEVVGKVCTASREIAEQALEEAKAAQGAWRNMPVEQRADYLFRAADAMRKKRFELSALEVFEVGKTWPEADADVAEAIDFLEYYGREMMRLGSPRQLGSYPGEHNEYLYEPKGIGVVISPWNFPIAIPAGMIAAGIVAGNCVLFKPSGLSPVSGYQIMDIFRLTGLPGGVLQFLPGPGDEVGEYLVTHPDTDFIAFTGSKEVGLRIVRHAGEVRPGQRNVKKVVAEMGGKNAIIIDETADIDEAIKGVLGSSLGFQGQKCSACSRVIVVGDRYARFCERLKEAMESIRIGPPEDPANFMGPVVDSAAQEKVKHYIETGKDSEHALLVREVKEEGYFCGPALFSDVSPDAKLAQDEIFGPVVSLMRVKDIDEAIAVANNTVYALTGGLYSRSPSNIAKVKNELRAGNLYINRKITGALVGRQPFGGFGMSGVGSKAGGPDYLLQFLNPKSISENTMRKGFTPEQH